jgi:uncharacterized protein DUF6600
MKKILVIMSIAIAIIFGVQTKNQAEAHTTVSFSLFFDALAPYGNWMSVPDYGYVWQPTGIEQGWRPYSDGHWVWTDYGWTWDSYQPWGWAPYHYGRWVFRPPYGWVWIPGTVWAPAWVTWYTGPSYIGWAPLPPDNNFFLQIGIGPIAFGYSTQPNYAVFVPASSFLYSNINSVAIPPSQNITIIKNTTNINNITIVNNRVMNYGPDTRFVEKATGVRVHKVNVVDNNVDPQAVVKGGAKINKLEGGQLSVFRPTVVKKGNEAPHLIKGENKKGGGSNQPSVYKGGEASNPPTHQDIKKKGGQTGNPHVHEQRKVTKPSGQTEQKKDEGK